MVRKKKDNRILWWVWGFIGLSFICLGAIKILTGEPTTRGGVIKPVWTGWVELPFGILILFLSIRGLLRNRKLPEPPPVAVDVDEEAARAEAIMDAMYLQEHGELPDKPPKDE